MSHRRTRKIRKYVEDSEPEPVPQKKELPLCFDRFLKEGYQLFDYMINNFDNMLLAEAINHFDIRYGLYVLMDESDIFREHYGLSIQNQLAQWIRQEYNQGRLFNKELWRPFRDQYHMTSMYFGYRKMFFYKAADGLNYCLQLALEADCENLCPTCDDCCDNIHFGLMFFGYRDNDKKLHPYNIVEISDEDMMIGRFWDKY